MGYGENREWVIDDEELIKTMEVLKDNKVTFAKCIFKRGEGFHIVAFEQGYDRDYCECNSIEFHSIQLKDIKLKLVPIWQCGTNASNVGELPMLNVEQFIIDSKNKKKNEKVELTVEKPNKVKAAAEKIKTKIEKVKLGDKPKKTETKKRTKKTA